NVVYAACQWGMLMAITRLGSPEMLGQFALGLAVTTPLLAFANLKAKGVQASDARREYHFREYFGLVLPMTGLALLVIAGVTLAVYNLPDAGPLLGGGGRRASPRRFAGRLASLAWLTLPLCFAALLLSLNANVPRYFIERSLGERELGLFAAMAFLLLPGTSILIAALGQAASPRLAC